MSGEGGPAAYLGPYPALAHRNQAEIAARMASSADHDVLAYLRRKQANAARVAASDAAAPYDRDRATIIRQFCDVLIGDVMAGLHHGEGEITNGAFRD